MKKFLSVFLAAVMVCALAACGSSSSTTETTTAAETSAAEVETTAAAEETTASSESSGGGLVGISMPTQSLERWNRDGSFLQEQFIAAGYDAELRFADNDTDTQVNDIQNLIAEGVDILVIAAIDGEALNTVMNDAADAGIPVIAYDRLIMNDGVDYYITFDLQTVGNLQGQFVADALDLDNATTDDPKYIEFTAGDPADNNATFYLNGAVEVLQPYLDSGVLVCRSGQTDFDVVSTPGWSTDEALNRAQNILASYYSGGERLDAWVCSNDSTALGVAQAVQEDYAGDNTVVITGQDGDVANLRNIVDGIQSMTVFKAVANQADASLDLAIAILNGTTVDEAWIESCGWDFDASLDTTTYTTSDSGHAATSIVLVPETVTPENYMEVLVDTGYYTVGDDGYLVAVE